MNKKDKEALKDHIYKVIGPVVDIEELWLKSTTEDEDARIQNFVANAHDLIIELADDLKIKI